MQFRLGHAITWLLCLGIAIAFSPSQAHTTQWHSEHRKPGSNIKLVSPYKISASQNQNQRFSLVLSTHGVQGDLTIHIKADPGIEILSEKREWFFSQPLGKQIQLPLEVIGLESGTHYIHVVVQEQRESASPLMRSLTVIAQVSGEDKSQKTQKSGTKMPAKIERAPSLGQ